jgi:hypothetical protein
MSGLLNFFEWFQLRLESENQMKEVMKEYEKTISELVADNKREKTKLEVCL